MKRTILLLSVLATSLFAAPAGAAIIGLSASLDGTQADAGAGTGSSAVGSIDLTYDTLTNELTWSGVFSGLMEPFTVAHFHGPAAANEGAGVQVGTDVVLGAGDLSGTSIGIATLTGTQETDLLAETWYWNVHSTFAPGGEIRGNISRVPEPGTMMLLLMGMMGVLVRRSHRA